MWGSATKVSEESTGFSSVSTSVGAIFIRFGTCILYPAANECQIGESLMQVTLSPQAATDLLFYLMKPTSMASVHMTMPSTARTFSSTDAGMMLDMDPEQRMRLKSAIETVIPKARSRRSGAKGKYSKYKTGKAMRITGCTN
jgi:hypothetical protein